MGTEGLAAWGSGSGWGSGSARWGWSLSGGRTGGESFVGDGILEAADFFDLDDDGVTGFEPDGGLAGEADALGGAGEDDGAGAEGHCAGEGFDEGGDVEDHVAGGVVLHDLVVEEGPDAQGIGIGDFVLGDDPGAEGAEAVEGFAAGELAAAEVLVALPVPGGDV